MPELSHTSSTAAPDFELTDTYGERVRLSDFRDHAHVVLVFNRGFRWPHCRRHMAQLRQDYDRFRKRGAEIIVVGPEDEAAFQAYWQQEGLPYIGLANPDHSVLKAYGQRVKLLKLGRLPSLVVVDRAGQVHFQHHGNSMSDIPSNERILGLLDKLNAS